MASQRLSLKTTLSFLVPLRHDDHTVKEAMPRVASTSRYSNYCTCRGGSSFVQVEDHHAQHGEAGQPLE